jgi:hypothetical protein
VLGDAAAIAEGEHIVMCGILILGCDGAQLADFDSVGPNDMVPKSKTLLRHGKIDDSLLRTQHVTRPR